MKYLFLILFADEVFAEKTNIRYRKAKKINFEKLLIEGQIKRPDISVVTGNVGDDIDGLLRLREHFQDQMAIAAGEPIR